MNDFRTSSNQQSGLTRREILKRGAALGGALAWGTPLVQVIGMSPAMAQTTSPGDCPNLYCLKAEVRNGTLGPFGDLGGGQGKGKGNCLKKDEDCNPNVPQSILDALDASVTGDPENGFTITLPPGCTLAEFAGGSEDSFLGDISAAAKCGRKGGRDAPEPCFAPAVSGNQLTFTCGNETSVSHIELIICCA